MDGSRLLLGVEIRIRQAFQVAIEDYAHQFTRAVDRWTAVISAADIACAYKVQRRDQVQQRLAVQPALWHLVGTLVVPAIVQTAKCRRIRLRDAGAVRITSDQAEFHTRCGRSIGILSVAE